MTVGLFYSLFLLILTAINCRARPDGPPVAACSDMRPQHPGAEPQTTTAPVKVTMNTTAGVLVTPGQYIQVSLEIEAGQSFKGFMIQARPRREDETIGTFVIPATSTSDAKTMHCNRPHVRVLAYQLDTAAHTSNDTKIFVTVIWVAPVDLSQDFRFYFTVVQTYSTYWVMESSQEVLGEEQTLPGKAEYIQAHGALMAVAWGMLVPLGIILALFYKAVWPNGHWFYIHITVMLVAILLVVVSVVLIAVHSEGKWLDTTNLNLSHQVLGVISLAAILINPLMGFFLLLECCSLGTKWRSAYNFFHGSIGLIFAQGIALAAMLVGVHILKDHPRNFNNDTVHYAIYSVSGIVAAVIMILALYNGYTIRYHKVHPKPGSSGDDDSLKASNDWFLRLVFGVVVICLLSAPVVATIYYLSQLT